MTGILFSVAVLALVTGAIYVCKSFVPVLSLGVLYLFAVLPVAVLFGRAYAISVALASAALFNFFFLPPLYTFRLSNGEHWFALAVYLVVGVVVSDLAVRARRRAAEAEQRGREEALLAQMATAFLQGESAALRAGAVRAGDRRRAARGERAHRARPRRRAPAGRVAARARGGRPPPRDALPSRGSRSRALPSGAGSCRRSRRCVAVAIDRERLAREAVETEALRRSDTIKTAVLQAVSHDLRSPLTAIRVAAESLESPGALARRGGPRGSARDGAARGGRGWSGSSATCSTSRGSRPEPPSRTGSSGPSRSCSAQALDQLGPRKPNASSSALPAERRRSSRSTPIQVERVLVNLLENALKFSPAGRVGPRAGDHDAKRGARARIVDRGPGIPEAELERIFEPFGRGREYGRARRQRPRARDRQGVRRGERRPRLGRVAARARARRSSWRSRSWRSRSGPRRERRAGPGRRRRAADPARAPDDAPRSRLRGGHGRDRRGGADEGGRAAARGGHPRPRPSRTRAASTSAASCAAGRRRPILILSAVGEESEKVAALDAGRGRLRDEALRPRRAARAPARGAPPGGAERRADDRGRRRCASTSRSTPSPARASPCA